MKQILALLIIVGLLAAPLACTTTRSPDGVVTITTDLDTTIALTQLALSTAQQAWDKYQQWEVTHSEATAQEKAAELAAREKAVQKLAEQLRALLALRQAK